MDISYAFDKIKMGRFVSRPKWGSREYLFLKGEVIMYSRNGYDLTWTPSHIDLLAEDWDEVIPAP